MKIITLGLAIAVLILAAPLMATAAGDATATNQFFVYFGTYTGKRSQGIYVSKFDPATGKISDPELAAETPNPTFLATFPRSANRDNSGRDFLYAANEIEKGAVTAYSIDRKTGKLTLLNQKSSQGNGPCYVSVDATGKFVYAANYGSGSMAALPVKSDGGLEDACNVIQDSGASANQHRQEGPHAHWIDVDPANRFVLACDLGIDRVQISQFDPATGMTQPIQASALTLSPGSGPRHLAFHPNGRYAYVINELSNTVTACSWNAEKGALQEIQTIGTLPPTFTKENTTAEIQVHPSGKFLFGSNRGHDSIAIYSIAPQTGKLTLVKQQSTQGKSPRNFAIDPTGQYLLAANQSSDTVVIFRINPTAGLIAPTNQTISLGAPVCIVFVPAL